ncbi:hypothetical protein, partial [Tsukamurella sputi]|uniref:hypothetical protein n=1 Tax=Tsukamurella sputi TaxID=2591848 RepID=UPI00195F8D00
MGFTAFTGGTATTRIGCIRHQWVQRVLVGGDVLGDCRCLIVDLVDGVPGIARVRGRLWRGIS